MQTKNFTLAIHGGAGLIAREGMSIEAWPEHQATMHQALLLGYEILKRGGNAVDAVELAVMHLEDSPLYNAGKGSVFNSDGGIELDAAVMCGHTLRAGAVAGVNKIRNPVAAARKVLECSPHVMLTGEGAMDFAQKNECQMVAPDYFFTAQRWEQWKSTFTGVNAGTFDTSHKHGTVGAVALDQHGHLCAATSTGGITNKLPGRVSDSAVIGAGTYANDATCAVSATGTGEIFIRNVTAYQMSALMEFKNLSLAEAAQIALERVGQMGGEGGLIALNSEGKFVCFRNTAGMFRGVIDSEGRYEIKVFED